MGDGRFGGSAAMPCDECLSSPAPSPLDFGVWGGKGFPSLLQPLSSLFSLFSFSFSKPTASVSCAASRVTLDLFLQRATGPRDRRSPLSTLGEPVVLGCIYGINERTNGDEGRGAVAEHGSVQGSWLSVRESCMDG